MNVTLALTLQRASRSTEQPTRAQLRRWVMRALEQSAQITIRLVDRPEGQALNREFRGQDHPTNVLTFVYGNEQGTLHGDLVLCAPVIKAEARAQKKPLLHHYAHLVIHGLLHLQGHDHLRTRQAQRMEALEVQLLQTLGIPNPYGEHP